MDRMNQLWEENQRLIEQNNTLRSSLEELISVNNELTESIEEFSSINGLEDRIRQLQNENRSLKNQLHNSIKKNELLQAKGQSESSKQVDEMSDIIKNLVESSNAAQNAYVEQITKLTSELEEQRDHWENIIKSMEEKYLQKINEYQITITNLKNKNENLNASMEQRMLKQSQKIDQEERKNLKVSTTIEDLRHVLEKRIEEKDRVIRVYETLIQRLKEKLKQKF